MGSDDGSDKKPLRMRRPRPSEIRRHGFGSPEGMEMTDMPTRRPAVETEGDIGQPSKNLSPSQSISPLEAASTMDSTPPSEAVADLSSTTAGALVPMREEMVQTTVPSPTQVPKEETPQKLLKRRLFFTPSRRKFKNTPSKTSLRPQKQASSPRISQEQTSPRPTDTPRPTTQLGTPAPRLSSKRRSSGRRRRRTGAPIPSGLSAYSTPRSSRRRRPPGSSGRRGFNPLERISDIFSPQSPDFSLTSPIESDFVPNESFDSSFSEESSSGSVKEPFAEQVERLSQLLATPSQQLGDLALTTTDYRSDDDLDDEMEDLEASRRLLAEELSRIDYSLLDVGITTPQTPEATGTTGGGTTSISPSPSPRRKEGKQKAEEVRWVPMLEAETHYPPSFSPIILEEPDDRTANTALSAIFTPRSPQSQSVSKDPPLYLGDELIDVVDNEEQGEDKKPAAKDYSSPEREKLPPTYHSPARERAEPTLPPEKYNKKFEGKKHSPLYTPPRPLPGTNEERKKKYGTKYSQLYTPPRPLSGVKQENVVDSSIDKRQEKQDFDEQTETSKKMTQSQNPEARSVDSIGDPALSIPQMLDEESNPSDEGLKTERDAPESIPFDPFGLSQRPAAQLSSSSSDLAENSNTHSTSDGKEDDIFQAFLSFAKRFTGDDRTMAPDFGENDTGAESPPDRVEVPTNTAGTIEQKTPTKDRQKDEQKDEQKEIFVTPPRSRETAEEVIFDLAFTSAPPRQDSQQEQTDTQSKEQISLIGALSGSDWGVESTASEPTSEIAGEMESASDRKRTKPSTIQDPSTVVPVFSDVSDDDIVYQKDSQHSFLPHGISEPAPGGSKVEPKKKEKKKADSLTECDPSKWNQRNWLFVLAITLLVTGIGLVIGTILFPDDRKTPAPSTTMTFGPTQEVKPAPITLAPIPSLSPNNSFSPLPQTPMPSLRPSKDRPISPSPVPSTALPSHNPSDLPATLPPDPTVQPVTLFPTNSLSAPSFSPSNSPTVRTATKPTMTPNVSPTVNPTARQTTRPTESPSDRPTESPTDSLTDRPIVSTPKPSTPSPSENPADLSSRRESGLPSTSPAPPPMSIPSTVLSFSPSFHTSMPLSLEPSDSPTKKGSHIPSFFPSIAPTRQPTFRPSKMPLEPSLPTTTNTVKPSSKPTATSEEPSTSPIEIETAFPTIPQTIISFPIPYKIFIFNGLVEIIQQSEYIPDLILSMDLLTDDILRNVATQRTIGDENLTTEVILPTSIIEISNAECPGGVENLGNSFCQEVIAEISLLHGEDSWQLFRDTTQLAILIGRLQYHLDRVNPNSPVEIIDSGWMPPNQGAAAERPVKSPSSAHPVPISEQRFPTPRPTFVPTPFTLLNLLEARSFDGGEALKDNFSPQHRAYSWLRDNERIMDYSEEQMLQRFAMATLYYATIGEQWLTSTLWMSNESECNWFGKTGSKEKCNRNGELVHLELDINNLNGSLPPELGLLSSALESITLSGGPDSKLSGTIPTEFGYLSRLKTFNIQNNAISGTIPSEIGNWQALTKIDLSQNSLRGELPTQIGKLSELNFFVVSNNELSGSLPSELGHLRKCQKMLFEGNAFVSSIPTVIGNLNELRRLKGGSNKFDSLPTELGKLTAADFISFEKCGIPGPIPTELGTLGNLRKLCCINCSHSICSCVFLRNSFLIWCLSTISTGQLKLEYNELSGAIPTELALMKDLQIINLSHNQLTGPLPTELGSLVDLRKFLFACSKIDLFDLTLLTLSR